MSELEKSIQISLKAYYPVFMDSEAQRKALKMSRNEYWCRAAGAMAGTNPALLEAYIRGGKKND